MTIRFDPVKRALTLAERGLDFADADKVFAGLSYSISDERHDYGEKRWQTYGLLAGRLVMVVWTERGDDRHIISMRKCNDRETLRFRGKLD
jgi:hypothetical protein